MNCSWAGAATDVLFKRDARAGGRKSRAIRAAVRIGCSLNDETVQDLAKEIYNRSRCFGGDINTQVGDDTSYHTPLMLAASANTAQNAFWVDRLLDEGASPSVESKNFLRSCNIALGSLSPRAGVQGKKLPNGHLLRKLKQELLDTLEYAAPLLFPFIQGNRDVWRLLLNKGHASPRLASPQPLASADTALTALHVAAFSGDDDSDLVRKLLNRFPEIINAECPSTKDPGITALHLAILSLSKEVFSTLLKGNPNLNAQMGILGRSPLHLIIEQMHEEENVNSRKRLKEFAEKLLEAGANVNRPLPIATGYTPLMALIGKMKLREFWPGTMKETGELLLDHGADPNFIALNGLTPLRILADMYMSGCCRPRVQGEAHALLKRCIETRNADPNSLTQGNTSLVGHVFNRHIEEGRDQGPLLKTLAKKSAKFTSAEANEYFHYWIDDDDELRENCRELYKMEQHGDIIDQVQIDRAYKKIFNRKSPAQELRYVQDNFPPPTDAASALWKALLSRHYDMGIIKKLMDLDFDGNWIHPEEKTSLVTQLIRLVCAETKYTANLALQHCEALFKNGASVLYPDPEGKTPIQHLRQHLDSDKRNLHMLMLALHERKDAERGEL